MAGLIRTIVIVGLVVIATAAGYLSIEAWRDAILGGGIAIILWIVASKVIASMGRFRAPRTSLFDRALQVQEAGPDRPADLASVERLFGWRNYAPDEFNSRIRPFISRLVDRRLSDKRGVELSNDPESAATYLGPNLRALLVDRVDAPADTARIAALIDEVEAL